MPTSQEFKKSRYQALVRIAKSHGGAVLAREYVDLRREWSVRCKKGHRFRITPKNMMRGLWCAKCRPLSRQAEFFGYAQDIARKHGGKCLSDAYRNARERLQWKCREGHTWRASFDNVVNKKSWCPACAAATISERKTRWWRQERSRRARKRH